MSGRLVRAALFFAGAWIAWTWWLGWAVHIASAVDAWCVAKDFNRRTAS